MQQLRVIGPCAPPWGAVPPRGEHSVAVVPAGGLGWHPATFQPVALEPFPRRAVVVALGAVGGPQGRGSTRGHGTPLASDTLAVVLCVGLLTALRMTTSCVSAVFPCRWFIRFLQIFGLLDWDAGRPAGRGLSLRRLGLDGIGFIKISGKRGQWACVSGGIRLLSQTGLVMPPVAEGGCPSARPRDALDLVLGVRRTLLLGIGIEFRLVGVILHPAWPGRTAGPQSGVHRCVLSACCRLPHGRHCDIPVFMSPKWKWL
mmetsp:Transcript_92051/g.159698  ORF Transcript_92051/g.159698 Transcript_92051/m.159698 type:complete len:258 (+) Transcript_92051:521-1294(+)